MANERPSYGRKFMKCLKANGYKLDRNSGDHYIFARDGDIVSVPHHLNMMIARRLVKEHGIKGWTK